MIPTCAQLHTPYSPSTCLVSTNRFYPLGSQLILLQYSLDNSALWAEKTYGAQSSGSRGPVFIVLRSYGFGYVPTTVSTLLL